MVQADWNEKDGEAGESFPWDNRQGGCFYRWYAHIQPCDHRGMTYTDITEKTHTLKACKYCKLGGKKEKHDFNPKTGKCRDCGYKQRTDVTVTFDANGGKGSMDRQVFSDGKPGKLDANAFTWENHTFKAWNTRKDGSGKSYADEARVDLEKDTTLYAQWYTNVTLLGDSLQSTWTGKPITVDGFDAVRADYSQVTRTTFPGVSATRTETDPGTYPVTPTSVPIITIRPTARPTATPKPTEKPQAAQRDYTLLARLKNVGSKGTSLQLVWTKVSGADGYDVYFAKNDRKLSLNKTVPASTRSLRFDGLNRQSSYKAYVVAWKRVKGAKATIGEASPEVYANASKSNKNTTNARSITLKKNRMTLKTGATRAIKASVRGMKSGVKPLIQAKLLRYFSSNRNVATVNASGRVTAAGKGRCAVYVMANNGLRVKVTVTVK